MACGVDSEYGTQPITGEIKVQLVPQGTLIERIRAAGCGPGGMLVPTGIGTLAEEGKPKMDMNGTPCPADVIACNAAMLGVFRSCGCPMQARTAGGIVQLTLDLDHA